MKVLSDDANTDQVTRYRRILNSGKLLLRNQDVANSLLLFQVSVILARYHRLKSACAPVHLV